MNANERSRNRTTVNTEQKYMLVRARMRASSVIERHLMFGLK